MAGTQSTWPTWLQLLTSAKSTRTYPTNTFQLATKFPRAKSTSLKSLNLPKPNEKFTHRVVISSITESPSLCMGPRSHKIQFKANEAYLLTKPFSTMIELSFDNSPRLVIPARKGFRERRITKKVDKRHIIVLDYYV